MKSTFSVIKPDLPSISSTFYVRIFRTNVISAAYNVTRENNVRTKNASV